MNFQEFLFAENSVPSAATSWSHGFLVITLAPRASMAPGRCRQRHLLFALLSALPRAASLPEDSQWQPDPESFSTEKVLLLLATRTAAAAAATATAAAAAPSIAWATVSPHSNACMLPPSSDRLCSTRSSPSSPWHRPTWYPRP